MKAPVQTTRRRAAQAKKRSRVYSSLLYRARKEVSAAGMKAPEDFLSSRLRLPTPLVLRLVSSEASRLSRSNRLKVVTVQEVNAAVALVQRRIGTKAAA